MLKTKKIVLKELDGGDAKRLSKLMVSNKKRFQRFFPVTLSQNLSEKSSKAYILLKQVEISYKSEFTYAIQEPLSGQLVGLVILKEIDWNRKIAEMAYCIGERFEGKGYATHTVKILSDFAIEKLGLKTLQIIVHSDNSASVRVAEKCGYIWDRTLEKEFAPPGETLLDMELYRLSVEKKY